MKNWKKYQIDVAEYFSKLGCNTTIEAKIKGARAKHEIDIFVYFKQFGFNIKWAVECKYWKKKIPKSALIDFKGKVDDIGINKGFMISEKGYQKGAFKMSGYTNIELLTFNELKKIIKKDFNEILFNKLLKKIERINKRIFKKIRNKKNKKLQNRFIILTTK